MVKSLIQKIQVNFLFECSETVQYCGYPKQNKLVFGCFRFRLDFNFAFAAILVRVAFVTFLLLRNDVFLMRIQAKRHDIVLKKCKI